MEGCAPEAEPPRGKRASSLTSARRCSGGAELAVCSRCVYGAHLQCNRPRGRLAALPHALTPPL